MMNDGILQIYQKIPTQNKSGQSIEVLKPYKNAFYGELSFVAKEWYEAKQSETEVAKRVRIHQDKSICNKHVIVVGGVQYEVGRTFSTTTRQGVAVTDITLERVTAKYDIG